MAVGRPPSLDLQGLNRYTRTALRRHARTAIYSLSIQGVLVERYGPPSALRVYSAESGVCEKCHTPKAVDFKQVSSNVRKIESSAVVDAKWALEQFDERWWRHQQPHRTIPEVSCRQAQCSL